MIFINLISLVLIFIFIGFKKFFRNFRYLDVLYAKKFVLIVIYLLLGLLLLTINFWKRMINRAFKPEISILNKIIIYFSCFLMSIIILFPQHLLINLIDIIINYFKSDGFSSFIYNLENIIDNIIYH